jgi:hypothetical protein
MMRIILPTLLLVLPLSSLGAAEVETAWNKDAAGTYLDQRQKVWVDFSGAARGEGATKTVCASCHTVLPYAFARPALRRLRGAMERTAFEQRLLDHTKLRVEKWKELDTPAVRLFYDFDDKKKKESWGTEAVLNALVLALDDRNEERTAPSALTRQAFAHLWQVQSQDGPERGSWDWLDFGLEPWESPRGRYFGATLAALAVAAAPSYYPVGTDAALEANVQHLCDYLKGRFAAQNLFNQTWALWAATQLPGVLSADERDAVIHKLLAQQKDDGGWSLPSLGAYKRKDGSEQETGSDGYATGLVLHVLQLTGMPKDRTEVARGLAWLRANQLKTGAWRGHSLNKKRDLTTHAGQLMTDAATGFAVLALSH